MDEELEWWDYDTREEMAEAMAGDVGFIIDSALDARGDALIIVPGGETPQRALALLAGQKRAWKRVTLVPTDDLLVPVDDDRAHVKQLARLFLPLGARVLPLTGGLLDDPIQAGKAAAARLADLKWPPDLAWLTVDDKGQVAAIAPGPDYEDALNAPRERRAVGVRPDVALDGADAIPRVTLTRSALMASRTVMLCVTGDGARAVVEQAALEGETAHHPVGRLLAVAQNPIDAHWSR